MEGKARSNGREKKVNAPNEKKSLKKKILSFLFAPICPGCGEAVAEGEDALCPACRAEMEAVFSPAPFLCRGGNGYADSAFALFPYDNQKVRRILLEYKKADLLANEKVYTEFMSRAKKKMLFLPKADLITFAPRTHRRRAKYALDQSEKMAQCLSELFDLPLEKLLKRRPFSRPQHRLNAAGRKKNAEKFFRPVRSLAGEDVLLIDDIVTTGATAREAARVLKEAGAMHVYVLCFAH